MNNFYRNFYFSYFLKKPLQFFSMLLSFAVGIIAICVSLILGKSYTVKFINEFTSGYSDFIKFNIDIPTKSLLDLNSLNGVESIHVYEDFNSLSLEGYDGHINIIMTYNSNNKVINYTGQKMEIYEIVKGSYFSDIDQIYGGYVCIIDEYTASQLFPYENPLGKDIVLEDSQKYLYKIIGVVKNAEVKNESAPKYMNIFIPYMNKTKLAYDEISTIMVVPKEDINHTIISLKSYLDNNYPESEIRTWEDSQERKSETTKNIKNIENLVLIFSFVIITISIIFIINNMLLIVNDREKEIGVKKALGASAKDILSEFMIQSGIITTLGTLIGMITGLIISRIITNMNDVIFIIPVTELLLYTIFFSILGLAFGVIPALAASKLKPIILLRRD